MFDLDLSDMKVVDEGIETQQSEFALLLFWSLDNFSLQFVQTGYRSMSSRTVFFFLKQHFRKKTLTDHEFPFQMHVLTSFTSPL